MFKQVTMIDVFDWDGLVESTYNRPYSFQQQDGCKPRGTFNLNVPTSEEEALGHDFENDSIPEEVNGAERGVNFKAWLERDPNQALSSGRDDRNGIHLFWLRNFYPSIEMVAYDLYKKGLLPAGKYTINIDW